MLIASSSKDVKFHTWPDGNLLHVYKPATSKYEGIIKTISWGKDGNWLVLVPTKGLAEVISVKDNLKHLHSVNNVVQPTCATFQNMSKKNMAIGTLTGQVLIYDIKSKKGKKKFPRASSTITKLEYSAKDTHLMATCENGEILLYSSSLGTLSASYKIPNSRTVSCIKCHPKKRSLVSGGSDEGVVAVWDINTNKTKYQLQAHSAPVTDVAFSPIRSDLLISLGLDRKFYFHDIFSKQCCFEFTAEYSLTAVDFYPDGIGLGIASQDGQIFIYDTRNMKEPQKVIQAHQGAVKQLYFQKLLPEEAKLYSIQEEKNQEGKFDFSDEIDFFDNFDPIGDTAELGNESALSDRRNFLLESSNGLDEPQKRMNITCFIEKDNLSSEETEVSEDIKKYLESKTSVFTSKQQQEKVNLSSSCNYLNETDNVQTLANNGQNYSSINNQEYYSNAENQQGYGINNKKSYGSANNQEDYDVVNNQKGSVSNQQSYNSVKNQQNYSPLNQQNYSSANTQLNYSAESDQQNYSFNQQSYGTNQRNYSSDKNQCNYSIPNNPQIYNNQTLNYLNDLDPETYQYGFPTTSQVQQQETSTLIDLESIRNVIKEEITVEVEQMKSELRHEFVDMLANMRRQFLEMQMSMVKEFVQLESVIAKLRDDFMVDDSFGEEFLVKKNFKSQKDVDLFKEKSLPL